MWYEIWDNETGNILTWHATEAEALAVVAATVEEHGREAVAAWALVREDGQEDGAGGGLAEGADLANLALGAPVHGDD